jgi:mono/diheme cytochrome c family protein
MKKKSIINGKTIFGIILAIPVVMFVAGVLSAQIPWFSEKPPLEFNSDMDNQFKAKTQQGTSFFADRATSRPPVEGTVPREGTKYKLQMNEVASADSLYKNTLVKNDFVIARGKNRFNTFCLPCHGADGKGQGKVVQKGFAPPPSLVVQKASDYTDSKIFHIISAGQGVMPKYGDKLSEVDRWAVVHYIRSMQEKNGLKPNSNQQLALSTSTKGE